jgi:hypothetical protein
MVIKGVVQIDAEPSPLHATPAVGTKFARIDKDFFTWRRGG